MSETKHDVWRRKVAHKRKKHEDKELMKTFDALTKDYNNPFDFEIERTAVTAKTRKLKASVTYETSEELRVLYNFRDDLTSKMRVPTHMLGDDKTD